MFGELDALPILGMPGNPVSALVCALLFLRPALRSMLGISPAVPPFEKAILGAAMAENDRREDYVRGTLEFDGQAMVVRPFSTQDSSMLMTLARANVLIQRPSFARAARQGDEVEIIRLEGMAGCF
jgi:molybdopterin molybdotransferase